MQPFLKFRSKKSRRRQARRFSPWQSALERLEDRTLLAVNIHPFAQTEFLEDKTKVISGLTVSSTPTADPVTLTLEVIRGELIVTEPLIGGVSSMQFSGSGTYTVEISGQVADINQTLASGLSYKSPANFVGDITLVMTLNNPASTDPSDRDRDESVILTVLPVADLPAVADDIANQTALVGEAIIPFQIPPNTFTDSDGDAMTLSVIGVPTGLTFTPAAASASPTGTFTGTPTVVGTFNVTVTATATDGSVSDTFTFTVESENAPPTAVVPPGIEDQSAKVGQPFSFAIPTTVFTDPDGDEITLSAIGVPTGLSFAPGPASANPTGNFTGMPTTAGTFFVTVSGGTSTGGSVSDTFMITVDPNGAPTVTPITDQAATVGQPFSFAIPTAPATFTDPEGDAITLSAIGVPAGLTFTAGPASANPTGNFMGTPTTAGTFSVTVTGASTGGSVSTTFTITVSAANQPPTVANALADRTVGVNQFVSFTIPTNTFTDPEGDSIMLTVTGLPQGITFLGGGPSANPTGTFVGAPTAIGTFNVTIRATATGGFVEDTFVLTVVAVNVAPSFGLPADPDPTVLNVLINSPAQTFLNFANPISAGPNEAQTVDFIVSNHNQGIFTAQPTIAANGTLTFTPAAGAHGIAIVSVRLHDNGGIANGGVDTSGVQTFTIRIATTANGAALSDPKPVYKTPAGAKLRAVTIEGLLLVQVNGVTQRFYDPSTIETLTILSGSKNDEIDLSGLNAAEYNHPDFRVVIKTGAGNDRIIGSFAQDSIDAGAGNDTLTGGDGDDTLIGNAGTDRLVESADVGLILDDTSLTGLGIDRLVTIENALLTSGDSGNNVDASAFTRGTITLLGGAGSDTLSGGSRNDLILGHDGDDELNGGMGNDTVLGGFGMDTLNGDAGNDLLIGGFDIDEIDGGTGRDTVAGGQGGAARGGDGVRDDGDAIMNSEVISEAFKKLFAFE